MHKAIKIGKITLKVHKFPKTAKNVSDVYKTGFRRFHSFECRNYSIVTGLFRIILSVDNNHGEVCG